MTNPDWYRTSYRRNLIDMHIEDWNPAFLAQFSPEDYVANLKRAHVKSAMIYLQSHVGLCYWNTASGRRHASFPNAQEKMQRLFQLCHASGIDVIAYYSMIYNNAAYIDHPNWRIIDEFGHSTRYDSRGGQSFNGPRYGQCCPNNPDYRQFVLTQLDEIFDTFEFEGIFLDMLFWTRICTCPACRRRWQEEHGGELPVQPNWSDPTWLAFQKKREDWMQEFCQMITDKVKGRNPACTVEHQYSPMLSGWRYGVNRNIAITSDYCGGDFYGGVPQHSVACKLYYNMTRNQPFEYMTSRCYPDLKEHTTTKTIDMLRQSVMDTLAHHGAALLIDAIDPTGRLDSRLYETYGTLFREAERYEPYMEGTMAQDVAVFTNLEAKYDPDNGDSDAMPHVNAVTGACHMLQEAHIPYGVFGDWHPEKMANAKVIIVPDAFNLPEDVTDFLLDYVSHGGKMYCSGRLSPRLFQALLGIAPQGAYDEPMTYMVPTEEDGDIFALHNRAFPLAVTSPMQKLDGVQADRVLATVALPYAAPEVSELHPDPLDGFDYTAPKARFASIHSNPPGRWLDTPSLLLKTVGRGKIIYSAAPFEASYRHANGLLFVRLIQLLHDQQDWSFTAEAPSQVELVEFEVPEKRRKLISLINAIEAFSVPHLSGITVKVRVSSPAKSVLLLPDESPVPFRQNGDYAEFHIDDLHICKMFCINY